MLFKIISDNIYYNLLATIGEEDFSKSRMSYFNQLKVAGSGAGTGIVEYIKDYFKNSGYICTVSIGGYFRFPDAFQDIDITVITKDEVRCPKQIALTAVDENKEKINIEIFVSSIREVGLDESQRYPYLTHFYRSCVVLDGAFPLNEILSEQDVLRAVRDAFYNGKDQQSTNRKKAHRYINALLKFNLATRDVTSMEISKKLLKQLFSIQRTKTDLENDLELGQLIRQAEEYLLRVI